MTVSYAVMKTKGAFTKASLYKNLIGKFTLMFFKLLLSLKTYKDAIYFV